MKRELVFVLISFIVLNLVIFQSVFGASNLKDIKWKYEGEWYSKSFGSFFIWKNFVEAGIIIASKFTVIEKEDKYGLMLKTESGYEYKTSYFVNYDELSGEVKAFVNYTLPSGELKILNGSILLNGKQDVREFLDPMIFINKTLGEVIFDLIERNLNLSFVGKESQTSIGYDPKSTPESPILIIDYKKIIKDDTSPVPENYTSESERNISEIESSNILSGVEGLPTERSEGDNEKSEMIEDKENEPLSKDNLEIINPKPNLGKVSIFLNEKEQFSIENSNYDFIKWYLDNEEVKENSKFYEFMASEIGNYEIRVEIESESEIRGHVWEIRVKPLGISEEESSNWFIWTIILLLVILFFVGIVYFLKKRREVVNNNQNNSFETNSAPTFS